MSVLFPDTHPRVEKILVEKLREAPAWRKLEMSGLTNSLLAEGTDRREARVEVREAVERAMVRWEAAG